MQQKVDELNAALEEANAKLLDVLEENHELRRSFVELRKNSTVRAREPSPFPSPTQRHDKRETFFEDSPLDEDDNDDQEDDELSELAPEEATPTPKSRLSRLDDLSQLPAKNSIEPPPLSPLSTTPPPVERRAAISATQDSYLARSLHEMSEHLTTLQTTPNRHSKSHKKSSSKLVAPQPSLASMASTGSKLESVPVSLTSAKRLPKPRSGHDTRGCATAPMMMGIMS